MSHDFFFSRKSKLGEFGLISANYISSHKKMAEATDSWYVKILVVN